MTMFASGARETAGVKNVMAEILTARYVRVTVGAGRVMEVVSRARREMQSYD